MSLEQGVVTLELAWKRISERSPQGADFELFQAFDFRHRARTAWNEKALLDYQHQIRGPNPGDESTFTGSQHANSTGAAWIAGQSSGKCLQLSHQRILYCTLANVVTSI